jgi:hypothetical protein
MLAHLKLALHAHHDVEQAGVQRPHKCRRARSTARLEAADSAAQPDRFSWARDRRASQAADTEARLEQAAISRCRPSCVARRARHQWEWTDVACWCRGCTETHDPQGQRTRTQTAHADTAHAEQKSTPTQPHTRMQSHTHACAHMRTFTLALAHTSPHNFNCLLTCSSHARTCFTHHTGKLQ